MTRIERYREFYEHEKDSNRKMLRMLDSVPPQARSDSRFQRAVALAAHLAACRENWLARMTGEGKEGPWWEKVAALPLDDRYAALEKRWTQYLANFNEENLLDQFECVGGDGKPYRFGLEIQIAQLVGHAFYHRGQIALLVEQLGGEPVDTDYLYWAYKP